MSRRLLALILLLVSQLCSAFIPMNSIEKVELASHFLKHKINPENASFVFYDYQRQKYKIFNIIRAKEKFSPSSTFQLILSLIALETKLLKDENDIVRWDHVKRGVPDWDRDQSLAQALRSSSTWFYQNLAGKMDKEYVEQVLLRAEYSNADLRDNLESSWISGQTRVSAIEQMEFLKKLYEDKLPFSKNHQEIVKRYMFIEQYDGDKLLYGKIGSTKIGSSATGEVQQLIWFMGYIKRGPNAYLFVSNLSSPMPSSENWTDGDAYKARIQIVKDVAATLL